MRRLIDNLYINCISKNIIAFDRILDLCKNDKYLYCDDLSRSLSDICNIYSYFLLNSHTTRCFLVIYIVSAQNNELLAKVSLALLYGANNICWVCDLRFIKGQ